MYYPNLKTSDSELRAIKHLAKDAKRGTIPVFELTRSRRTKALPMGSLKKRLQQLLENYGGSPYILDLCTQDELMNSETIALFSEQDGYENWRAFLKESAGENVIPCVLYEEDGSKENFQKQAIYLRDEYGKVCLRTSATDDLAQRLMIWLSEVISQDQIVVCALLYYIEPGRLDYYKELCRNYMRDVVGNRNPSAIMFPSSSFPRVVTDLPGCEDDTGTFSSHELALDDWLQEQFPNRHVQDSDFAAVHPIRYPASGGNWIPRIDIFTGSGFRYMRVRRNNGGY
ncbi:MAG TPA: hypothetical protein VIN06_19885, partial [Devosia sp.]